MLADRRCARALALACAGLCIATAPAAAAAAPPQPLPLETGWELALDPGDHGLLEGWPTGGGSAGWQPVSLPHVVNPAPLEQHFAGAVAWYRLTFTGPPASPVHAWAVRFEQARRAARVWLNGSEIGASADPYLEFEIEAAGLRPDEPNHLLVRVDYRRPAELREGWWNWGGLIRPVWLVPRGPVTLREVGLLPRLACTGRCEASVLVDGEVANRSPQMLTPVIEVTLVAPDGTVTEHRSPVGLLAPGMRSRVSGEIHVQGVPALWWPERPRRYAAIVRLRLGDEVVEEQRLQIGLRSVRVQGGRLLLNGRPLSLRGASIQEDAPGRGAALAPADIDWIGRELRAIGADVTRAHYPLSERLMDRLDALGILVWSQAPIYHRDDLLRTSAQRAGALATVRGTVLATRNHPSVITHSVANELASSADERAGTAAFLREARLLTRRLDPTLPVAIDLMGRPGVPRQRAYAAFDLLGTNCYFGWYRHRRGRPTATLADLAPYLRDLRRQYPRQAIVLSEFGAEALRRGSARVKGTLAFQARYVRRVLRIAGRLDSLSGAIYWTLREFAVKPRWNGGEPAGLPRDGIHNKGLVTYAGRRKPAWHVARRWFRRVSRYRRGAR
jgi:beta-glucuronidase